MNTNRDRNPPPGASTARAPLTGLFLCGLLLLGLAPTALAQTPSAPPPRPSLRPAVAASPAPSADDPMLQSYLFQVALLVANREGSSNLDDLPKNTRKPLEDIRDFLPFKSYEMLDVAVIRSNGHAQGQLNGPNDRDYEVAFDFQPAGDGAAELWIRSFELRNMTAIESDLRRAQAGLGVGVVAGAENLVAASFTIAVGETVVVGSSKLDGGGRALIVLLTAIP